MTASVLPNLRCLHIHINRLRNDACMIHRANREFLTALIWKQFSPHVQLRGFKTSHSASSRTRRKREGGGAIQRAANVRNVEKLFQELLQCCTTLQWLSTPVCSTDVLLRQRITSRFRRLCSQLMSPGTTAEVESSAGTSQERLTSLKTVGSFTVAVVFLLIPVVELRTSRHSTFLTGLHLCCFFFSLNFIFIYYLWLRARQLFCSSRCGWIFHRHDFHSAVGSCLPAINVGIWSLSGTVLSHQSQYIYIYISITHIAPSLIYGYLSLLQFQYGALPTTILNRRAHTHTHKSFVIVGPAVFQPINHN